MRTTTIVFVGFVASVHTAMIAKPVIRPVRAGGRTSGLPPSQPLLRAMPLRGGAEPTMSALAIAETVCPALGFILSNALYASPLPALKEAVDKGSLGTLNPLPSGIMVIGTTAWVGYAMACKNPWIAATNIPGALVAYYQLVTMLPLMKPGPQLKQFQLTVLGGAAATLLLWAKLIFGGATAAARSQATGIFATIICIILFASPLSTIADVVKTRNSASILAPLTFSQVANCALWTTYGVFAAKDIFVWGPNGTGLILGLVQLALKLVYPSKAA